MPDQENQRQTFNFLQTHFETGEPFTREDLRRQTDWSEVSFNTYWAKQLKGFVAAIPPMEPPQSRRLQRSPVSDAFRSYARWEKFRERVTQVRSVSSSEYSYRVREQLLIYKLYMLL